MVDNRKTSCRIEAADAEGADQALRASEDRFRYIIKYDPNAIAVLDKDLRYIFVSDRFLNDYKVTEQDVIGRCHYDVFPEMPERWKEVHQRVLAGAVEGAEEDAFVRADGSVDYNRWECRPWHDADGNIGGLIMYTEVITERKRSEKALQEAHSRLKATMDALPDLLFVVDRQGRICDYRAPHPELLHVPPEEFIGREMSKVLPKPAADIIMGAIADAFAHQGRHQGSIYFLETAAGLRWFELSIATQGDPQTPDARLVMLAHDITDRKQVEEALRASEERFRSLVEASSDWVWAIDQDGRYTYASPKVKDLLGYDPQEVIGRRPFEFMPPDEAERVERLVTDALRRGRPVTGLENINLHKDGRRVVLETSSVPIFDEDGQLLGHRGIDRDITERKRAAEQLKALNETLEQRVAERTAEAQRRASQLQRLAGELTQAEQRERQRLGQVLHDNLQQLLVAAKFNVDSLRRRLSDPEQQRFVRKVDELLGESLATSRSLTAELSPPILYEGNLAQVLHWLGRRSEEKYGLAVAVTADEQADPASQEVRVLLFQAVRELLLNITKHAGVDRALVNLTRLDADRVQILVADEGAGFDPERKQTEQAGAPSTSRFGLFSIRERLELMGGSMEIRSELGRGTRILLTAPYGLPGKERRAARTPAAELLVAAVGPVGGGPAHDEKIIHVMLADDHAVVRDGLARLLQTQSGMEVVGQAADGQEAVTLALQLRPDVILMDVSMPVMNGVEATRRITPQLPNVCVIGLSMHAQEDVAAQMMAAGATAYLTKTTPPETLIAAIQEHAARALPRSGA